MKHIIEDIRAIQVLDSRGWPTVRCEVRLTNGALGWAVVPSGASTGAHEAYEKRDGGEAYLGRAVTQAVDSVNGPIARALIGLDATRQQQIDDAMIALDGTENKSRLGANAILAVSMAVSRAAANSLGIPLYRYLGGAYAHTLPVPMMNILNGGAHASNNLDIQEFMIRPVGAKDFPEAVQMCVHVYRSLGALLKAKGLSTGVGDEGGFAPNLEGDEAALKLIVEAIERAGYKPGTDVTLALDVAATEWAQADGTYLLPKANTRMTREALIAHYEALIRSFPIDSIEDPLGEDDFEGFTEMVKRAGIQIVGDDLFTTNPERVERGMKEKSANAVLVKLNQIGTVSEAMKCVRMTQAGGWQAVISHRSGETEDSFIADLAVATNAGQIKAGAPARTDRTAKYNRLLEIADEMARDVG